MNLLNYNYLTRHIYRRTRIHTESNNLMPTNESSEANTHQ